MFSNAEVSILFRYFSQTSSLALSPSFLMLCFLISCGCTFNYASENVNLREVKQTQWKFASLFACCSQTCLNVNK